MPIATQIRRQLLRNYLEAHVRTCLFGLESDRESYEPEPVLAMSGSSNSSPSPLQDPPAVNHSLISSAFRRQPSQGQMSTDNSVTPNISMFDGRDRVDREPPPVPTFEGVDYNRAAGWGTGTCTAILNDEKGRQLFRVFLFQSLAEENLTFIEAIEKLKKMKKGDERTAFANELLQTYQASINLSSGSMKSLRSAVENDCIDPTELEPAVKEVKRLLENDQFPRFRRSEVYLACLEELLPLTMAEKWAQSFEGLLSNQVGRHHFRLFLRSIHAEENLRFWEAVVEFRGSRNKNQQLANLAKVVLNTYLAEGTASEVFLPFGVRQVIERRINDTEVDISLFDEAIKHVEQVLRNDPYVRFLQSKIYIDLLSKLK